MTKRGTPGRGGGRMRRVDEAVKQVLSEGIQELKDPGLGFVTVTGEQTTSDLAHATVWVSAGGVLQGRLARELHLRRTPQLVFAYDHAVERGVRMNKLIDELAPDSSDDSEDERSD